MYTITDIDGQTFTADTWPEIKSLWEEIVMADGADDAEITIKFTPEAE